MVDRVTAILMRCFLQLRDRQEGQAAVEYSVLLALIIAVCILVIGLLGGQVQAMFQKVVDGLTAALS